MNGHNIGIHQEFFKDEERDNSRGACWQYNVSEQFPIIDVKEGNGEVTVVCGPPHEGFFVETSLLNGKPHGASRILNPEDILVASLTFENGVATGPCRLYDDIGRLFFEGSLVNGYREGKGKEFDERRRVTFEGFFKEGKKTNIVPLKEMNGYWKEVNDKNEVTSICRKDDRSRNEGICYFFSNGIIERVSEWKNGMEVNVLKRFEGKKMTEFDSGMKKYEGGYRDSIVDGYPREGEGKEFGVNGRSIVYRGTFKNGKREGNGMEYAKGEIVYEGNWKNGKRHGDGVEYDKGEVVFEGYWDDGKRSMRSPPPQHVETKEKENEPRMSTTTEFDKTIDELLSKENLGAGPQVSEDMYHMSNTKEKEARNDKLWVPIDTSDVANLTDFGISSASLNIKNVTMASEKFVCISENRLLGNSLTAVDLTNIKSVTSDFSLSYDSIIMNPESKMVALRKGTALQVFNLETKSKVSSFKLPDNNNVVFWCWIDAKTIAIVTQSSVFHWSIEGESNPRKVMDRHLNLAQCQIINYRVSPDQKWCMLVGHCKGSGNSVAGIIQLYSSTYKASQLIPGHCGGFIHVDNQIAKGQLVTFITKEGPRPQCKFQVIEAGRVGGFKLKPVEFAFPADAANDFPVGMEIDERHTLAYVMTHLGYVYMFDIMTGTLLFHSRISPEPIFLTTKVSTGGIIGVASGKGRVIKVTLNENNLVPYVLHTMKKRELALELACRLNLPGADDIFMNQFNAMMQQGNIKGAAQVAYKSPKNLIRNENTIRKLQQMPAQPGQQPPFVAYIGAILEQGRLNEIETIEFCKIILQQGKKQIIGKWMKEDKITCSEALGDLVVTVDRRLATAIYLKCSCREKALNPMEKDNELEKILGQALSNDDSVISDTIFNDLTQACYNEDDYRVVSEAIWKTLDLKLEYRWKILKALNLITRLINNRAPRIVDDTRNHIVKLSALQESIGNEMMCHITNQDDIYFWLAVNGLTSEIIKIVSNGSSFGRFRF